MLLRALTAGLIGVGFSVPLDAKGITLSQLEGQWRVYKSGLADPEGVQAYGDEQLRGIVGNKLLVSRSRAQWLISHGRAALHEVTGPNIKSKGLSDPCSGPTIQDRHGQRFNIHCSDGSIFGPGDSADPTFSMLRNGNLKLDWWDGLVVYLRKIR